MAAFGVFSQEVADKYVAYTHMHSPFPLKSHKHGAHKLPFFFVFTSQYARREISSALSFVIISV